MGKGYLRVQTLTAGGAEAVSGALVTITDAQGQVLHELGTDKYGYAPDVALTTEDKSHMEDPDAPGPRYSAYNVTVHAPGFTSVHEEGAMVFDTSTSLLTVEMEPMVRGEEHAVKRLYIGGHKLDHPTDREQQLEPLDLLEQQEYQDQTAFREPDGRTGIAPIILPEVTIPNYITVHLGSYTNTSAQNVRVPFAKYVKNVASHEIFDEWAVDAEQAVIANVHCIISLTLNRVYTEFYRTRYGYSFDITSETNMDQKYVHGGVEGTRISAIVDRVFNQYLAIVGHREPFLALYNDGRTVNIPGRLSQWGSFYDARDRGMTAWQIIDKYYTQNLELRVTNQFGGVLQSYPGYTLSQGTRGDAVRRMQLYLNRVLGRYSDVIINPVDGVFGTQTANAVRTFQQIYGLPQTGTIDQRTWYEISRIYGIEKGLWEMYSEGERIGVGTTPPTQVLRRNDTGPLVVELQFLLDFIALYHNGIPFVPQTSRFDALTEEGVRAFQRLFNITADGVVGATTWRKLYDVYWGIRQNTSPPAPLPPNPTPPSNLPPFPGTSLTLGSTGAAVRTAQEAINRLADSTPGLWRVTADGVFGNGTRDAVMAFQRIYGLTVDGIIGPNTWRRLMEESNTTVAPPPPVTIPPYPGASLSVGATGNNVRLVQEAINRVAATTPGLWRIAEDGVFGNGTRDAVMAFQRIFGLTADGVVGPATWDRLMREAAGGGGTGPAIPAFPGNLQVGASGANVRQVQEAINRLAPYYPGRLWILTVDGQFGNMTRDAVFTIQSLFGLPITGVVNQATWDRLMREAAGRGAARYSEDAGMETEMGMETDESAYAFNPTGNAGYPSPGGRYTPLLLYMLMRNSAKRI